MKLELNKKEEEYLKMLLSEEREALKVAGEKELIKDIPTIRNILRKLKSKS
jgi:hypothetical protein